MSAYRDDAETLRARVDELERELAALRAGGPAPVLDRSSLAARVFGAPMALSTECVIDAPLDDARLEEILETLRERLAMVGTVTRTTAQGAVVWQSGPPAVQRIIEVVVRPDGDRTRVRIVERLAQLVGGLFGGVVGGVGGGIGMGLGVPLMIALHAAWLLPVTIPLTVLGAWLAVRAGFAALARGRRRELEALTSELARLGEVVPKTRVADVEREDARERERDDAHARDSRPGEGRSAARIGSPGRRSISRP